MRANARECVRSCALVRACVRACACARTPKPQAQACSLSAASSCFTPLPSCRSRCGYLPALAVPCWQLRTFSKLTKYLAAYLSSFLLLLQLYYTRAATTVTATAIAFSAADAAAAAANTSGCLGNFYRAASQRLHLRYVQTQTHTCTHTHNRYSCGTTVIPATPCRRFSPTSPWTRFSW